MMRATSAPEPPIPIRSLEREPLRMAAASMLGTDNLERHDRLAFQRWLRAGLSHAGQLSADPREREPVDAPRSADDSLCRARRAPTSWASISRPASSSS